MTLSLPQLAAYGLGALRSHPSDTRPRDGMESVARRCGINSMRTPGLSGGAIKLFEVSRYRPYDSALRFAVHVQTLSRLDWEIPTTTDGIVPFARTGRVELPGLGLWMCGGSNHTAGGSSFRSRMRLVGIRLTAAVDIFWIQSRVQTLGRKRTG